MNMTFNSAKFMPAEVRSIFSALTVRLTYGRHALERAASNKNGSVPELPAFLLASDWSLVEAEAEVGARVLAVQKFVVRQPMAGGWDLAMVVIPDHRRPGNWFVKTLWMNRRTDNHRSLNGANYASEAEFKSTFSY